MSPGDTELLFVILYNITALHHNASIFSKSSNSQVTTLFQQVTGISTSLLETQLILPCVKQKENPIQQNFKIPKLMQNTLGKQLMIF